MLSRCRIDVHYKRNRYDKRHGPVITRFVLQGDIIRISEKMALHKDNFNLKSTHEIKPRFSNLVISRTVSVKAEFACQ